MIIFLVAAAVAYSIIAPEIVSGMERKARGSPESNRSIESGTVPKAGNDEDDPSHNEPKRRRAALRDDCVLLW